jgi:predicted nucleic acid-binding protein
MIDPFDTKGLIRLEMDKNNQTICKYNEIEEFNIEEVDESTGELINLSRYNEFIKTVEPNLNRILFSKKVILVEGPNDVLVYKYAIKKKILEVISTDNEIHNKEKYSEAFLNFENISIVCHHGKATANYLIELCKHFDVDYFVINDWDFELGELSIEEVSAFNSLEDLKNSQLYIESEKKAMITTNYNLIKNASIDKIHFNIKKLESVINYNSNDKSSLGIWNLLQSMSSEQFNELLVPPTLLHFIGLTGIVVVDENIEKIKC